MYTGLQSKKNSHTSQFCKFNLQKQGKKKCKGNKIEI